MQVLSTARLGYYLGYNLNHTDGRGHPSRDSSFQVTQKESELSWSECTATHEPASEIQLEQYLAAVSFSIKYAYKTCIEAEVGQGRQRQAEGAGS